MTRVFIDTFSSLDDVPKKMRGDSDAVFHALSLAKRFSVFEVSESPTLANTVKRLEASGKIKILQDQYPWYRVEIPQEQSSRDSVG